MKAHKVTTLTIFLGIIVTIVWTPNSLAQAADTDYEIVDPNEIPDVLSMLASVTQANFEKIKTWQGEIKFTISRIYKGAAAERKFYTSTDGMGKKPKFLIRHIDGRNQFAVDLENDFLYNKVTQKNPPRYMDFETGRDLGTKAEPSQKISIFTPEYYIDRGPYVMRDGIITDRKAVKKARKKAPQKTLTCMNPSGSASDPRESFRVGAPIWEIFPRYVEYINLHDEFNVDGYTMKMEKYTGGNITKYHVRIPGRVRHENYRFVTMVFSSAKGFNIISYEATDTDGKIYQRLTWEYELISDIYLPVRTTQQIFERENSELSYEERKAFNNQKINEPIPAEIFTYKNLGFEDGDKFIDETAGKEFEYKNGELIELVKKPSEK